MADFPAERCDIEREAVASQLSVTSHPQRQDVAGAHKARDKRRVWMVVDLFRGADLRDPPGIENRDAVGYHHRFLPVVRHMHGGDAEGLLQCLDLVTHLLADARVEIG